MCVCVCGAGVAMRDEKAGLLLPGGREGKNESYESVCVCVCVGGYGWRGEKWRVRFSAKGHKGHNIVVNNVLVNTK